MRFHVIGADKETGNDIEIDISATDRAEAEGLATKRGVLVSAVQAIKDADPEEIALVDMDHAAEPSAGGTVAGDVVAAAAAKGGSIAGKPAGASVAGASAIAMPSPGVSQAGAASAGSMAGATAAEAHGSISGAVGASTSQPGAHMEYHIIMNQSLYLLEVAVNKHLKDGWEPQGGLTVGISNNAMQYFQAMIRHKD